MLVGCARPVSQSRFQRFASFVPTLLLVLQRMRLAPAWLLPTLVLVLAAAALVRAPVQYLAVVGELEVVSTLRLRRREPTRI